RCRLPGRQEAGGSGSMRATRVRAAPPTARPASCGVEATAIATCSTATRPHSNGSGARPTEFLERDEVRPILHQLSLKSSTGCIASYILFVNARRSLALDQL